MSKYGTILVADDNPSILTAMRYPKIWNVWLQQDKRPDHTLPVQDLTSHLDGITNDHSAASANISTLNGQLVLK